MDEVAPSVMMRKHMWMRTLRAPAGTPDGSDVNMGELSAEEGGAEILAPRSSTDVEAAYEVVLEGLGKVSSVYDVWSKMSWTVMRTGRERFCCRR